MHLSFFRSWRPQSQEGDITEMHNIHLGEVLRNSLFHKINVFQTRYTVGFFFFSPQSGEKCIFHFTAIICSMWRTSYSAEALGCQILLYRVPAKSQENFYWMSYGIILKQIIFQRLQKGLGFLHWFNSLPERLSEPGVCKYLSAKEILEMNFWQYSLFDKNIIGLWDQGGFNCSNFKI